jgi:phosphoglycerate dehydrogenase-like enzyme
VRRTLIVAAEIDPELARLAAADGRFDVRVQPVRSEEELRDLVAGANVLVTRTYNNVSRAVIEAGNDLEVIAQATSGTDNIDEVAARQRGVAVITLPGENANAVAEMVLGCMLSLTRTLPLYTREVMAGRWSREDCASRHELRWYRLGIIGLGNVGRAVSRLAAAFGMNVAAFDPYLSDADFAERGARRASSAADLVAQADIITLHVPLTAETRRMVDAGLLARTNRGTILINAARGEVLDTEAALDALAGGRLGGLALDVYSEEPPSRPWPDDPRLILTPHVAGCTHECRSGLSAKLFRKISDFYATR